MKDKNHTLTLKETEQLCRLYMDCRLTVFEETELQYVLGQIAYSSPLIDEVRILMGIQSTFEKNRKDTPYYKSRSNVWRSPFFLKVAASLTLIIGIGLYIYYGISTGQSSSQSIYIAYADGKKLNEEEAKIQIESDKKRSEAFMNMMAEREAQEKQKIELINNKFNEK